MVFWVVVSFLGYLFRQCTSGQTPQVLLIQLSAHWDWLGCYGIVRPGDTALWARMGQIEGLHCGVYGENRNFAWRVKCLKRERDEEYSIRRQALLRPDPSHLVWWRWMGDGTVKLRVDSAPNIWQGSWSMRLQRPVAI